MKDHYSSIVIGAGPAGIMASIYASARGDVLLIDSMDLPRHKSCGGMLNEYSQDFLNQVYGIPKNLFCEPEWINFRFFDWDRALRKATSLRFANVDRVKFDAWLLTLLPSNVEVMPSTRLVSITQNAYGVTATLKDAAKSPSECTETQVHCEYLVGCDGPRSTTRRLLPVSQLELYKTLQEFAPLEGEMQPYFDCIYSRNIGAEYGYGYVIPKGEQAIIGSVFFPGSKNCLENHKKALEEFQQFYPYSLDNTTRESWTAVKVVKVSDIIGGHGRVLLAGEAGGIMSPSSGEGISFAMNSGKLAGIAIAQATEIPSPFVETEEPSQALMAYREMLKPIKRNIRKRLAYFPVLNSNWGKWLGGSSPKFIVDQVAHRI